MNLLSALIGLYLIGLYSNKGKASKIIREAETLADDLLDPLAREPVNLSKPLGRDRIQFVNFPRIHVSRPGYEQELSPQNAPPLYWANSEAHTLPDGSITLVSGRTPLHQLYAATQEYYAPDLRPQYELGEN